MKFLKKLLAFVIALVALMLFLDSGLKFLGVTDFSVTDWVFSFLPDKFRTTLVTMTAGGIFMRGVAALLLAAVFDPDTALGVITGVAEFAGSVIPATTAAFVSGATSGGGALGVIMLGGLAWYFLSQRGKSK
jgi:hypothetical protein